MNYVLNILQLGRVVARIQTLICMIIKYFHYNMSQKIKDIENNIYIYICIYSIHLNSRLGARNRKQIRECLPSLGSRNELNEFIHI
jgi:hypothetical protein